MSAGGAGSGSVGEGEGGGEGGGDGQIGHTLGDAGSSVLTVGP